MASGFGGVLVLGPLLMVVSRHKYPRRWLDWNLGSHPPARNLGPWWLLLTDNGSLLKAFVTIDNANQHWHIANPLSPRLRGACMTLLYEKQSSTSDPHDRRSETKTTTSNLLRLAGASALLAGVCYVLVGIFHPANVPSSVTTTRWEIVHILACAMSFFGVLGMTGLYARQAERSGRLGLVGYVMFSFWLVLIMGFSFVEAFILPRLATAEPRFVESWMGMFTGPVGNFNLGALPT